MRRSWKGSWRWRVCEAAKKVLQTNLCFPRNCFILRSTMIEELTQFWHTSILQSYKMVLRALDGPFTAKLSGDSFTASVTYAKKSCPKPEARKNRVESATKSTLISLSCISSCHKSCVSSEIMVLPKILQILEVLSIALQSKHSTRLSVRWAPRLSYRTLKSMHFCDGVQKSDAAKLQDW